MSLQFRPPTPKFRTPQKKTQPNQQQKVYRKAFTIALSKENPWQGSSIGPKSNQPCFYCNQIGHGPGNALIPRRVEIKIKAIRNSPMLRHALGMCTIQLWRKFPWEKLLLLVCFFSPNTL